MLDRSSLPVVELGRFPPLFYLSLGALLGLLVVTFVLGERAEQKQAELLREYGTALAQISAQDVMDASISSDLVSMHAIMQRVAAQPRVLRAAVHDLEQQLLVQAGQGNIREQPVQAFTAPIPLHDRIDGHVTITMHAGFPGESAVKWTLTGTAILLLIMVALAAYEARGVAWYFRKHAEERDAEEFGGEDEALVEELMQEADAYFQSQNEEDEFPPEDAGIIVEDAGNEGADTETTAEEPDGPMADPQEYDGEAEQPRPQPPAMRSDLILALPNRARLEQQLNGERFLQLAWHFEKALDDVLALYGGTRVGANADASVVCVRFTSNESLSEAAFRALCSAYLVYELTQMPRVHFQLVAEICHPDTDVKLAVTDTGIYMQKPLADAFLDRRIETTAVSDQRLRLESFKGAYAPMLQRQLEQLQSNQ